MKKVVKKSMALLLAGLLVFGSAPLSGLDGFDFKLPAFLKAGRFSLSASAATYGYYEYDVFDGEATITSCDTAATGAITIPETLDGNPVTSIGDGAFYYCVNITSVIIPDGVTSIGAEAFAECAYITSVTIPDSVTSIGDYAFYGCFRLTSVTIPDGVERISDGAFYYCSGLTSVTIPNSVTSIGAEAFWTCESLTSFTVPDSLTSIGDYVFQYCTGLTDITIPDSVESIGDYVFQYCTALTSLTICESVTSIGTDTFDGCTGLTFYGFKDSYAETYADEQSIPFVVLITAITNSGCVVDTDNRLIYALAPSISKLQLENDCINLADGYSLAYSTTSDYLDIGLKVTIVNDFGDERIATFSIVHIISAVANSGCVVDTANWLIYGLVPGVTKVQFEANYINLETGYLLTYSAQNFGNGTLVTIKDASNNTIATFKIIIIILAAENTGCVVDFNTFLIRGLVPGVTKQQFESNFIELEPGFSLSYSTTKEKLDNGTQVTVKNASSQTVATFTIRLILCAVANSGCVVDIDNWMIYALAPGISKQQFKASYINLETGYSLVYSTLNLDTGTEVYINNASNETVATFTLDFILSAVDNSGCMVNVDNNYIYGLAPGITKVQFEANYVNLKAGYSLTYSTGTLGTGTQVSIKNASSVTVATFTIVIFGEMNGDGAVTASDALMVLKAVSGSITLDEAQKFGADVDHNSTVSASDALKILKYVSGSITEF